MSDGPFSAPADDRTHRALITGTAALAALGIQHATVEWTPRIALYAVGRPALAGHLPRALAVAAFGFAAGMLAGRAPRAMALGCCAALALLHALVPQVYHNNYYVLWLYLLIVSMEVPPGFRGLWFLDGGARALGTSLVPRLVQAQVALIYLLSVAAKLAHPWWRTDGAVVRWIVTERVPESGVQGLVNPLLAPLLTVPAMAAAAQTAILGIEVLLPFMLFSARWRRTAFAVGAVMHTVMQEWLFPQLFTFLMLLGYYAFVPAGDRAWTLRWSPSRHPWAPRVVPALDWLGRVACVEDPAVQSLVITARDGRAREGVGACWMLGVLSPVGVLSYAALALLAPGTDTVLTLPRAMVENALVMGVGVIGLFPGKTSSHRPGG